MRIHSVIVFQIYYLYINIDPLSQYIWTLVVPHYIGLMRSYCNIMQINDDKASSSVDSISWCSRFFVQGSMVCRLINKCSADEDVYVMNGIRCQFLMGSCPVTLISWQGLNLACLVNSLLYISVLLLYELTLSVQL